MNRTRPTAVEFRRRKVGAVDANAPVMVVMAAILSFSAGCLDHLGRAAVGPSASWPPLVMAAVTMAVCVVAATRAGPIGIGLAGPMMLLDSLGDVIANTLSPSGALHPLVFTGPVVALATMLTVRDASRLERRARASAAIGALLLTLPAVPFLGVAHNGARSWINVAGRQVDPTEIGQLLLVIGCAAALTRLRDRLTLVGRGGRMLPNRRVLAATVGASALGAFLLAGEHNLGPASLLLLTAAALLAVGSGKMRYPCVILAVLVATGAAILPHLPYLRARVAEVLTPLPPHGLLSAPLSQAGLARLITSWGGWTGAGLGHLRLTAGGGPGGALPAAGTDYPLTVVAGELGALGVIATVLMLAVLLWSLLHAARWSTTVFTALLGAGLFLFVAAEVTEVTLGALLDDIPMTGVTVPFISAGASSAACFGALIGLAACSVGPTRSAAGPVTAPQLKALLGRLRRVATLAAAVIVFTVVSVGQTATHATSLNRQTGNPLSLWRTALVRGDIFTAGSTASRTQLATVVGRDRLDTARQRYPLGALTSGLVGTAPVAAAPSGLQGAWQSSLTCSATPGRGDNTGANGPRAAASLPGCIPADITTTINLSAQRAAQKALAGRTGAVFALDGGTGAVLAAYSTSDADPAASTVEDWNDASKAAAAEATAGAPLWDLPLPPGSSIKPVIALAAERARQPIDRPIVSSWTPPGGHDSFSGYTAETPTGCGGPIADWLAVSCNAAAGAVATSAGSAQVLTTFRDLHLTGPAEVSGIALRPGTVLPTGSVIDSADALALSGIGQGDTRVTLAALARSYSVFASGGLPALYTVASVCRGTKTLWTARPQTTAVAGIGADQLEPIRTALRAVVTRGTARDSELQLLPGVVAGKTGTAQLGVTGTSGDAAYMVAYPQKPGSLFGGSDPVVASVVLPSLGHEHPVGGQDAAAVSAAVLQGLRSEASPNTPNC